MQFIKGKEFNFKKGQMSSTGTSQKRKSRRHFFKDAG